MLKLIFIGLLFAFVAAEVKFVDEVVQNFDSEVNTRLTDQINKELTASYVYQGYASYFGRADVALPGFQKFFSDASKEEREHAQKLIDYVNMRGGHVQYSQIDLAIACVAMADENTFSSSRSRACICEFLKTRSSNECEETFQDKYGLQAMEDALALERYVNKQLLDLHKLADGKGDSHLTHVLEHEFLEEQVTSIRELAGYVTRLRSFKMNYALGEYLFDQKLQ